MIKKENTGPVYSLTLYIMGASPNSARAVSNVRAVCSRYMPGRYELKIIDVYQQQGIAKEEQLVALPMLVKHLPLPVKKMVGNMSDVPKILNVLEIENDLPADG